MAPQTSLFLAPADPRQTPSITGLVDVLRELAIIDTPLAAHTYLAGDGFMRHIVFAGCSPQLRLTPPADDGSPFCHIALHGPFPQPHLVTGPNTVKPRCPHCRARINDWRAQLASAAETGGIATCPGCSARVAAYALDWRGHALGARVLIEMRNVFPGEASPSDQLLDALRRYSGDPWRYAWAAWLPTEAERDTGPTMI